MEVAFFENGHNCHKTLLEDIRFDLTLVKSQRVLEFLHLEQLGHEVDDNSGELKFLIIIKAVKIKDEHIDQSFN